ncbi:MAG: KdsC family phosphatase [Litorivicinaceae bacterium]
MSAQTIRLMAFDVDGIFTDGRLYYGPEGDFLKAFHTQDGLGLKLLQAAGLQVAIITGRLSSMVERRFAELGVPHVITGRDDKREALQELAERLGLELKDCGYMGDDLPDLAAGQAVGFFASVPNAVPAVIDAAQFVSSRPGGHGAVRETCRFLLEARGQDEAAVYRSFA